MIRTPEQYVKSLNDGRVIFLDGEQIPDITKHPAMKGAIARRALSYVLANDPEWRDLFTVEEDGERRMFVWTQPKTAEDLVRRREIYMTAHRIGANMSGMGPDALAATGVVAARMDKELGTHYTDALEDYRRHLKKTDPAITGAITDVKGNRSLRPSAQEQHKDFYVRVMDRQKDGIIVRGAKMHISTTPDANELIVSPCRAHREEDKDYAVVFATPVNAKGITLITSPGKYPERGEEAQWNWPDSGKGAKISECMIVFDDVFVPWNRVFMCGEYQFSRDQAWLFGVFHRLYGASAIAVERELKLGTAALMAEYNGTDRYPHIQEKLAWMAMDTVILDVMARSACEHPDVFPDIGLVAPNTVYTNIAKFRKADECAENSKILADITGGLIATVPSYKDWMNPKERPFIEKYLAGKAGVPTEDRLKAIRLAKDLTSHNVDQAHIHGEGSLAAQKMHVFGSADWNRYKAIAKRIARIPGWKKHPELKNLPDWPWDYEF